jgi:PAS domain S-box-containing protein
MTEPATASTESEFDTSDASALLRRQAQVLELVAAAAPVEQTLDAIILALEDLIPGARCSVLLLDPTTSTLCHGAAPNLPEEYLRAINGIRIGPRAGSCGTAAFLGERVVAVDVRSDERWTDYRQAAVESGLISCWSSPIAAPRGDIVGTFAVYHADPHQPTVREKRLVDRFTYLASVAIENSRLLGDLVESEELFRRSFEDNPAGVALLRLDRSVERVNKAMTQLTGYRSDEMVGQPLDAMLQPHDRDAEQKLIARLLAGDTGCITQQMQLRCRTGPVLEVEATTSLIRGRKGQPSRLALNLVDLTERLAAEANRRARQEAEVARQTAEEHSRAKSALLTSVSHEVRTPLQAIKGFTELLSTLDLDEKRREEALARINLAADHLLDLVTDVLDISRIEAGALALHCESVALADIVEEVIELLTPLATDRNVGVQSFVDRSLLVRADRRRLRQVVLNLAGNAIRHGRRCGHVEIYGAPTGNAIQLEIRDDGPGIPPEYLSRMFTPFARGEGEKDPTADVDGYGLGLMLAHGLTTAMHGDLKAANSSTGGAIFTLLLPRPDHEL